MILIEDNRAPNPRRVRIFLAEKNVEIERRHIDIMEQEHKSPEMLARNPFMRIPVPRRKRRASWRCGSGAWSFT